MSNFKYSIIIPHKNTPNLLSRCVASIPKRDDLQIVIVDDNSDPSIVDFDNFPIKNDERTVIIFDKSGKGAFFNASSCNSITYVNRPNRVEVRNEMFECYEKNPRLYEYYLRYEVGAPWSKIIRKDLITNNNVTFEEVTINNDTKFSYLTGHNAKKVKVDQRAIYCATFSPSSISYTMNDEKYLSRMHTIAEQIAFCRKNRQDTSPCKSYSIEYLRDNLTTILQSKRKDLYDECLKIVDSYGIGKELRKAVKKRLLHIKVAVFIVSISKAPLKWIKYFK